MASSHHFNTPSPSFSSFGAAWVKLCCLPSLVRNTCLLSHRCIFFRRYKVRFALNKIKSSIIFADTVDALIATFAVWTRPSSKGWSSATNHCLTWPRSQVAGPLCFPLSVHRSLAPPMPPFPPEDNILQYFYYMYFCIVYSSTCICFVTTELFCHPSRVPKSSVLANRASCVTIATLSAKCGHAFFFVS